MDVEEDTADESVSPGASEPDLPPAFLAGDGKALIGARVSVVWAYSRKKDDTWFPGTVKHAWMVDPQAREPEWEFGVNYDGEKPTTTTTLDLSAYNNTRPGEAKWKLLTPEIRAETPEIRAEGRKRKTPGRLDTAATGSRRKTNQPNGAAKPKPNLQAPGPSKTTTLPPPPRPVTPPVPRPVTLPVPRPVTPPVPRPVMPEQLDPAAEQLPTFDNCWARLARGEIQRGHHLMQSSRAEHIANARQVPF